MDKETTVENPEDYFSVYKHLLYGHIVLLRMRRVDYLINRASPTGYSFGR